MNSIIENLYLGGIDAACSPDYLTSFGVTHVLTLDIRPVDPQQNQIVYKFIKAQDHPDYDLLTYLDECYDFIEQVLSPQNLETKELDAKASKILVHCQFGVSRSATVVVAYLMRKYNLTVDDAIQKVREHRLIGPNFGFLHQLTLYEKMGKRVDKKSAVYREYFLKKLALSARTDIPEDILPDDDFREDINSCSSSGLYQCRNCRRGLFTSECLVKHQQDSTGMPNGMRCSDNLFIWPMRWMVSKIREPNGKIQCPHCDAKIGAFRWSGHQCGCGTWVTPAFYVQLCKLDCPVKQVCQ